ncbi:MAG: riboflavin biosynthesis protein RibF [Rickettsiales bacterium]|nr:riboflavin biosynthesis protein RibF [Rickettsiales bacterium]|tara:strand:+ start:1167 stop:2171 length:1005 start_codon:yes stop_codon:yes gene_type:complete
MKILYGYQSIQTALDRPVMTMGTFDGLHLGHRTLIECVVTRARKTGRKALVYSFYPPPWRVLGRGKHPYLILTFKDKVELLSKMGVDYLVTEEFSPDLQRISHQQFAHDALLTRFAPSELHIGYDFHFGRDRLGDWGFLHQFFTPLGIEVRAHGAVRDGEEIIGCSTIREKVREGRVNAAARMLGRFHFMRGVVVRGRGRGRTIGFPTANIEASTELSPPPGVYACRIELMRNGSIYDAIANLGFRPTFAEQSFAIEAHLFDFSGDLYGEKVRIHFVKRVRDERNFDQVEELVAQIHQDLKQVQGMLPFSAPPQPSLRWDPKPQLEESSITAKS